VAIAAIAADMRRRSLPHDIPSDRPSALTRRHRPSEEADVGRR